MNNSILLEDCIKEFEKNNELSLPKDDLFELFSISQVTKKSSLSVEDIESSIVDGERDGGIDCLLTLVDDAPILSEDENEFLELNEASHVRLIIGQVKNKKSFLNIINFLLIKMVRCASRFLRKIFVIFRAMLTLIKRS